MTASTTDSPKDEPEGAASAAVTPLPRRSMSASFSESETSMNRLFATKENTAFKWQRARGVVGALEITSEPMLQLRRDLTPHYFKGKEKTFHDALQAWEDLKLRDDFVKASERLAPDTCCCGFLTDQEATKQRFVALLNDGWCKNANKKLLKQSRGVKVDVFLWNWQNASGKAETNILLIRFFELSSYRFRRASADESASIDLELLDEEDTEELKQLAARELSSPNGTSMDR